MSISTIGERIAERRKQKGLTQVQLAKKLGRHESSIRKYEAADRIPKIETLNLIANALDTTVKYLTTGEETKSNLELLKDTIKNMEKEILEEGYSENLVYLKGKLDGLRSAINLINESEEK
ncbi:helix-turn-helix domain-containing protein [Clostridium botulinum]|nr:helix-turn-helix domain-containing protein [Clostridium botulinum]NFI17995.1 helix-turn-helix domain-containing protein [Clostridium botulinum]NFL92781.1 helix-turn-helix domain-containing protein [Clostridium botulinum]NFN53321.1 helix-turn-helix domain-containing protein [Clostridium botulinum]NFO28109.1 helix-turn-helix domain-containing protein [Clostridium botulinum]